MKRIALALALALPLSGCVATSADLLSLEQRIVDRLVDGDEGALTIIGDEIEATVEDIEGRIEGALEKGAAAGGLIGLASALGLNVYRNSTRKRDVHQMVQQDLSKVQGS